MRPAALEDDLGQEADEVRDDVGVDAALDQSDVERRMSDAAHRRAALLQSFARIVNCLQNARRGGERVDARFGHGSVPLLAAHRDFQMQAAVADRVVRAGQPLLQEPARTDVAADLFVIGEMQFDAAAQRMPGGFQLLQCQQGERVSGEVGFTDGHAAAIHHRALLCVFDNRAAVGILSPTLTGRHNIAVRIQSDAGTPTVAEFLTDDQVGDGNHAGRTHGRRGHGVRLDGEAESFQQ